MQASHNIYDLLSVIDDADGLYELVRDGMENIDGYDVPDDLKEEWDNISYAVLDVKVTMERFTHLLNTYARYYDEHHNFDAFKDEDND